MKKYTKHVFQLLTLFTALLALNSCDGSDSGFNDDFDHHNYPPFFVSDDHRTAVLNGTIDSNSLSQFNQMIDDNPEIEAIHFDQAPGSVDDDVNIQIGRNIHNLNLDTHIVSGGIIASGAVDLFLAGRNRTRGFNTSVGVHSWANSEGNQAADYPVNSNVHDFYINYYLSIGLGSQLANDFYFYSINAADADDIHFMTENEIQLYEIFTN